MLRFLPCGLVWAACLLAGCAGGPERPYTEAAESPEVTLLVARELHEHKLPVLARAHLLSATRHGSVDPAQAEDAQRLVDGYESRSPFERAAWLAQVLASYWTPEQANEFWFTQASAFLDTGEYADTMRALGQLPESMDIPSMEKRESLTGLALLQQSRMPEAVAALEKRQGFPNQRRIEHFNFAVSMIGHARRLEGLALLDELAEMPRDNAEDMAVGDRASTALGWIWLKAGEGGSARASYKRVNLKGPYSNRALLGLGWTELAPDGTPQKIAFKRELSCGDVRNAPQDTQLLLFNSYRVCRRSRKTSVFTYYRTFAFEPAPAGRNRYAKALIWWRELAARDATDPAVQEAWLALAYAQAQAGDPAQAAAEYRNAITRYDREIARLAALGERIRADGARAPELLAEDRPGQFAELRSSRRYHALATDLRRMQESEAELAAIRAWLDNVTPLGEARQQQVAYVRGEWERQRETASAAGASLSAEMAGLVLTETERTRARLQRYRADAVLGLARLLDRR